MHVPSRVTQDEYIATEVARATHCYSPLYQTGHRRCFPADSYAVTGEVIATYHYHEAEVEKAPAIVGYTALLAASEGQYRVRPCGYR